MLTQVKSVLAGEYSMPTTIRGMRRRVSLLDNALDKLQKLPNESFIGYAIYCQHYDTFYITFFTGFRMETVVRKVPVGLPVLKQAPVPILAGPLPPQVLISQTITPRQYLIGVFTTWFSEIQPNVVSRNEQYPTKAMKQALAEMFNSLGLFSGHWGWLLQHKRTRQGFATACKLQCYINEYNKYLGDNVVSVSRW